MAGTNFLPFNEQQRNQMDDSAYMASAQRLGGVEQGIADPVLHNKLYRQSTAMSAAIARFLVRSGLDAHDGDIDALSTAFQAAVLAEGGGGDMSKSIYDINDNGRVDRSEDADKLGGALPAAYLTKAVYDTNDNGRVDRSEDADKLGGALPAAYLTMAVYDTDGNGRVDRADDADKLGGQIPSAYLTKAVYDIDNNGRVDRADDADKLGGALPAAYQRALTAGNGISIDGDVISADVSGAASPWEFVVKDNPVAVRPAAGSLMRVTGSAAGTLWAGGKNIGPNDMVSPSTASGVTYTRQPDGSIVANGITTGISSVALASPIQLQAGAQVTVSGSSASINVVLILANASGYVSTVAASNGGGAASAVLPTLQPGQYLRFAVQPITTEGTVVTQEVIRPQIERGAVATPYEPYRGQTVTIAAGTPVDVGAVDGTNVLSAGAGILTVEYNRDSMDVLEQVTKRAEATGAVARIDGLIDHLPLDVTARSVAAQAGTGNPAPDNVRAISGRAAVTVSRAGSNMFNVNGYTSKHEGIAVASDRIVFNNPASAQAISYSGFIRRGQTYTLSFDLDGDLTPPVNVDLYPDEYQDFGGRPNGHNRITFTVPSDGRLDDISLRFYARTSGGVGTATISNIQLESGAVGSAYAPYRGQSFPIALPSPVYGLPSAYDTVALRSGVIARRTKLLMLTGTESWTFLSSAETDVVGFSVGGWVPAREGGQIISSHYKYQTTTNTERVSMGNGGGTAGNVYLYIRINKARIGYVDEVTTSTQAVASFKAFLAAQAAAGTPVQILYERATPITEPIDPVLIPSLLGANTVWANAGLDMVIAGQMSAAGMYDAVTARLAALELAVSDD